MILLVLLSLDDTPRCIGSNSLVCSVTFRKNMTHVILRYHTEACLERSAENLVLHESLDNIVSSSGT